MRQNTQLFTNIHKIPFLDTLIKRNKDSIWIALYLKPTDTQRCLLFTSSHPNYCKRNIPFCLARRVCTIGENNAEKLKNLENLKSNLSKYYSPDSLIKQGFRKALSIPSKDLRKLKNCQMKTSCHSLQHLIQTTLIFIWLLNPLLTV